MLLRPLHGAAEKESAILTSAASSGQAQLGRPVRLPHGDHDREGTFTLDERERENLRKYCRNGGVPGLGRLLLEEWDRSFRARCRVFPAAAWRHRDGSTDLPHGHGLPLLTAAHGQHRPSSAVAWAGGWRLFIRATGLNDTAHAHDCCCCGGTEITNAAR